MGHFLSTILICLLPLSAFAEQDIVHYTQKTKEEINAGQQRLAETEQLDKIVTITEGMTEEEVIRIIGEPVDMSTSVWEYPQGVIIFEDGKVKKNTVFQETARGLLEQLTDQADQKKTDATTQASPKKDIPTHCPHCKVQLKKVPVVYGLPGPELIEQAEKGEIFLGGCIVYEGQSNYAFICPKCKEASTH